MVSKNSMTPPFNEVVKKNTCKNQINNIHFSQDKIPSEFLIHMECHGSQT